MAVTRLSAAIAPSLYGTLLIQLKIWNTRVGGRYLASAYHQHGGTASLGPCGQEEDGLRASAFRTPSSHPPGLLPWKMSRNEDVEAKWWRRSVPLHHGPTAATAVTAATASPLL